MRIPKECKVAWPLWGERDIWFPNQVGINSAARCHSRSSCYLGLKTLDLIQLIFQFPYFSEVATINLKVMTEKRESTSSVFTKKVMTEKENKPAQC